MGDSKEDGNGQTTTEILIHTGTEGTEERTSLSGCSHYPDSTDITVQ